MKWIVLTLFALNIALGGWLFWQESQPPVEAVLPPQAQLNNLGLDAQTLERVRTSERQPAATTTPAQTQCIRITGLTGDDQAQVIQARLGALEVVSERQTRMDVVRSDYWVVLGPFDSQAVARDRLAELQSAGIESFLIGQGDLAGGISLGLFSTNANAQRRQQEMLDQDINARIERVDRTQEVLLLNIGVQSARLISDGALESILRDFEGVGYQRYAC